MKRREFLRSGAAAAATPTLLPLLNLACTRDRPATAEGLPPDSPVRITANENPLGVPESVRQAMIRGFERGHEYPGESGRELAAALAERHGVEPEAIVLGNGSTDLLRMVLALHLVPRPGGRVVTAVPTFDQVAFYTRGHGGELVERPLREGTWAHDLDAMRAAAEGAEGEALVYICNPNNPTGTLTPVEEVKAWIEEASPDQLFLVDEAYFEFVEDPSYESLDRWARERPNVVVIRTFSKIYAMAGIRVGYGIAHPRTVERLRQLAVLSSPNHLGCVAGLAGLREEEFVQRTLETNRESRRIVYETLDELEIDYMESHTNFVMHEIDGDVDPYRDRMREAGILVGRPFPPFRNHNRVSLGTPDQMRLWGEAVRGFRERGWV